MSYENYFEKPDISDIKIKGGEQNNAEKMSAQSSKQEKIDGKKEKKVELNPHQKLMREIIGYRKDPPEFDDQLLKVVLDMLPKIEKQTYTKLPPDAMRQAVILRFGFEGNNPHAYHEVGSILGVSRNRARQLTEKALRIFRHEWWRRKKNINSEHKTGMDNQQAKSAEGHTSSA